MKKVLLGLAVVAMLSTAALAGPYIVLENEGAIISPTVTIGGDFSTAVQTTSRVFGDVHWDFPAQDLSASIGAGFSGAQAEIATLFDFNYALNALREWDTSFTVIGNPFYGFKVWGGVSFNFDPTPSPEWELVPVFGIEARW